MGRKTVKSPILRDKSLCEGQADDGVFYKKIPLRKSALLLHAITHQKSKNSLL